MTVRAPAKRLLRVRRAAIGMAVLLVLGGTHGAMGADLESPAAAMARFDESEDDVPARSVYLVLRLRERRLHVMEGDDSAHERRLASFPVAIGRPEYATPTGRFRVLEKVVDPDFLLFDWQNPSRVTGRIEPGPQNPLGARWIGFANAYGWTIGFHGTPDEDLLGQAVSHGCVRMRNRDVVKLYGRVDIGTPVIVEP